MQWMTTALSVSRRAPSVPRRIAEPVVLPVEPLVVSSAQSAKFGIYMLGWSDPKQLTGGFNPTGNPHLI